MGATEQMLDANWARMRRTLINAATEYRAIAQALDLIKFDSTAGMRRSPDSVISEAAYVANPGRAYSDLIHGLALWAESINDLNQNRTTCGYRVADPALTCVLAPGHDLPMDDGLLVHVSDEGVMFA